MGAKDRTLLAALGFQDPDKANPDHGIACRYLTSDAVAKTTELLFTQEIATFTDVWRTAIQHDMAQESSTAYPADVWRDAFVKAVATGQCPKHVDGRPRILVQDEGNSYYGVTKRARFSGQVHVTDIRKKYAAECEKTLSKGHGQYRTTVGFLDVVIRAEVSYDYQDLQIAVDLPMTPEQANKAFNNAFKDMELKTALARGFGPVDCYDHHDVQRLAHDKAWLGDIGIEVKIGRVDIESVIRQINVYRDYGFVRHWVLVAPWAINPSEADALGNANVRYIRLGERYEAFRERVLSSSSTTSEEI